MIIKKMWRNDYNSLILWTIIMFTVPSLHGHDGQYECGSHGRFEYCIDAIPGCVIGCHCHPGYYFDTDTKICEPNIKLTQDFRRHYVPEPTRIQSAPVTFPVIEEPMTTTTDPIDRKLDEITKDADDLGDWLYNQFFKTIENQVINNTKDEDIQTRRSGNSLSLVDKPSRRSGKYRRSRKKKKKKNGFKSKLLRITEDDSLFDSSSGSTSDESSSSSSSESSDEYKKKKNHSHKKILMVNKRPRPPLPSFIFLPNMETPFFPPIGLPPPAVPMYPMVPVPPMMAPPLPYPPYPYSGNTPNSHDEDNEHTTEPSTTISTTTTASTNDNDGPKNDITTIEQSEKTPTKTDPKIGKLLKSRSGPRQKLMQKLQAKIKRKNKLQNYFVNRYQGPEPQSIDTDMPPDFAPNSFTTRAENTVADDPPLGQQDVDFKYLSQLIHRGNLNKSGYVPPISNKHRKHNEVQPFPRRRNYFDTYNNNRNSQPINNMPVDESGINIPYQSINNTFNAPVNNLNGPIDYRPNRPANNILNQPFNNVLYQTVHNIPKRKNIEGTNDTYYANLGRQIASMIRNFDGDKEVDIQIERTNTKSHSSPVFNENIYGSRSYWERSVRSPFQFMKSYRKEMDQLKRSNENLYSLENEVEMAASTLPTLSLQQLENILKKIDEAKSRLIRKNGKMKYADPSKTSFNVNLLPENQHQFHSNAIVTKDRKNTVTEYEVHDFKWDTRRQNPPSASQPKRQNRLLSDFLSLMPDTMDSRNESVLEKSIVNRFHPTRQTNIVITPQHVNTNYSLDNVTLRPQALTNSNPTLFQITTNHYHIYKPVKPMIHNQKTLNYYSNNQNEYTYEKATIPVRYPTFSSHLDHLGGHFMPSYFHHQLHHFDYFDK